MVAIFALDQLEELTKGSNRILPLYKWEPKMETEK
jgi:hypothetical protein